MRDVDVASVIIPVRNNFRELYTSFIRYLFGEDVFISYSRADALTYAAGIADQLSAKDFSCFLDQWGTPPGQDLPRSLRRALKRSSVLVLVGTPGAACSEAVGLEIRDFVKTGRPIIPIDFDRSLETAPWFHHIVGLARTAEQSDALKLGNPGPAVLSRIEKSFNFTRRNRRVRRSFLAATIVLLALVGVSVYAGKNVLEKTQALFKSQEQTKTAEETAQKNAATAAENEKLSNSRALAATAVTELAIDPEVSVQLARKGYATAPTREAEDALRESLFESHAYYIIGQHQGRITGAAFSPDGQLVVVASGSGAEVMDLATGAVVSELRGHSGPVLGAAFNPKGDLIVTAGADKTARIWNWRKQRTVLRLVGHTAPLTTAQFDPTGESVVTTTEDNPAPNCTADKFRSAQRIFPGEDYSARVWSVNTGALKTPVLMGFCSPPAHGGPGIPFKPFSPDGRFVPFITTESIAPDYPKVWDVSASRAYLLDKVEWFGDAVFSPDGKLMATVTAGTTVTAKGEDVNLISLDTGAKIAQFTAELGAGSINAMSFSPDSKQIATANGDYKVRLWTIPERQDDQQDQKLSPRLEFFGHVGQIRSIAFDSDGDFLLTGSDDGTARVWEVKTGKQVSILRGHTAAVRNAVFSPNGQYILTTSDDQTARLWTASMGQPLEHISPLFSDVQSAQLSSAANRVLIVNSSSAVHVWNADSSKLASGELAARVAAISPNGDRVATAVKESAVVIYDPATGAVRRTLGSQKDVINFATFSPDSKRIFATSDGGTAHLWDTRTGAELVAFKGPPAKVLTAIYSNDGSHVLTSANGNVAQLWDLTGEAPPVGIGQSTVTAAALSPDGKIIVSNLGYMAEVLDSSSGVVITKLSPSSNGRQITAVAFSPDGRLIVTTDAYFAKVWKVPEKWEDQQSGMTLGQSPVNTIRGVVFSPDSRLVATLYQSPGAVVWKADSGEQLGKISEPMNDAVFNRANELVAVCEDGAIRVWDPLTGKKLREMQGNLGPLKHVSVSSTGQMILAQADEARNAFLVWNTRSGKQVGLHGLNAVFSPNEKSVLALSGLDRVRVRNADDAAAGVELRGPTSEVTGLSISSDGEYIAGSASDGTIWIWEVVTARVLASRRMDMPPKALIFSPDGNLIAIDTERDRFQLWAWKASGALRDVTGRPGTLSSGLFSHDSKYILSRDNREATVWKVPENEGSPVTNVKKLSGRHTAEVNNASFNQDGEFIVTASDDATAMVWQWKTNNPPVELRGHSGPVFGAKFSSNGKYVATTSRDGTARVWESETGKSVTELFGHQGTVREATFSSDDQFILTFGDDHRVRIYGCSVCAEVGTLMHRAAARPGLPPEQLRRYTH